MIYVYINMMYIYNYNHIYTGFTMTLHSLRPVAVLWHPALAYLEIRSAILCSTFFVIFRNAL